MTNIRRVDVARDSNGYWCHPDFPDFQGSVERFRAWMADENLESCRVCLEEEDEDHPVYQSYFDGDPNVSGWEPKAPEGGDWFLLGLWDTEDGPFAWYVRPKD
jgi:hypothetical protein